MPRSLVLVVLSLALVLASPAIAQPTPGHAGDAGPPDHANAAGEAGPPDHAAAVSGAHADEAAPATSEANTEAAGTTLSTAAPTGPEPADTSSSAAPAWSGAARLLGPTIVVGLLAVGLVARARYPEDPTDQATEADEEPSPDEQDEPTDAEPVDLAPPQPGPIGLLTLGRRALDRGDVEAAADWFRTATMADPDRQAAHFCLGLCLAELDRVHEAEAALSEARRQQPGDLEAAYAHAQVLARQGRTETALHVLERLADEMPGLAERLRGDEDWACLHDHPRWLALATDPDGSGWPPA